jgi:hypothetical protein
MSLQISKNLLEKINSLYQNISLDGEISSIERDLMLSYTRQFYEAILAESSTKPETPAAPRVITPAPVVVDVVVPAPPPPPPVAEIKIAAPPTPPAPIELVVTPSPAPAPSIEVEVLPPPPPVPRSAPVVAEQPIVAPKPIIDRPAPVRPTANKPLIKPTVERVDSNQLFEEKMSKELSDKLGELPIADIKKAMSLNERIIFVNELFDGNFTEFENALTNLNSVANFAEAKGLMEILATRFDWSSKEKQAKTFIKLVKRRHP